MNWKCCAAIVAGTVITGILWSFSILATAIWFMVIAVIVLVKEVLNLIDNK